MMVVHMLAQYGLFALFLLILLESVGLPLPGESMLVLAAAGAAQGLFPIWLVLFVAASAAIIGDSIGYWIGARFGLPLLERYGAQIHVPASRLAEAQHFMERYGPPAVFFGRFIAVLRVFAAFLAGVGRMPYQRFVLYNVLGGIVWATVVGLIGFFFGSQLPTLEHWLRQFGWGVAVLTTSLGLGLLLVRRYPHWVYVQTWIQTHPRLVGTATISLLALGLFGKIADSVAEHETLAQLDLRLAPQLQTNLSTLFGMSAWYFTNLGSLGVVILTMLVAAILAWRRQLWELAFWVLAIGGAEALNLILKAIFQRPRPIFAAALGELDWSFPSGHAMASVVAYGALALLLVRRYPRFRMLIYAGAALVITLIGASRLVLGVHYLTDVVAGFAAGIAWLALCFAVFEMRQPHSTAPADLTSSSTRGD